MREACVLPLSYDSSDDNLANDLFRQFWHQRLHHVIPQQVKYVPRKGTFKHISGSEVRISRHQPHSLQSCHHNHCLSYYIIQRSNAYRWTDWLSKTNTLFQLLIKCSKSIVSGLGKNEYNLRHWSLQRRQAYLFGYDWFPNWPACEILCKRWWTHFPSNWFFSSTYTNHASGLPCSKLPRFRYEAGSMEHKHLLQK